MNAINYVKNKAQDGFTYLKGGAQKVGSTALECFLKYVAEPVEKFAIGDLRSFEFSNLKKEFAEGQGFALHRFGFLGNIALWQPKSKQELKEVLNELDSQPSGRSPYRVGDLLVKGSGFVIADTGPLAIPHRKEIVPYLKREPYIAFSWDLWKTQKDVEYINFRELATKAIAKGLLGIELTSEECSTIKDLSEAFKGFSAVPIPAFLLKFDPSFKKTQANVQEGIEGFLKRVIEEIKEDRADKKGLLVQEILKKMDQNPMALNLHQDPDLKSLILSLIAADNLGDALDKMNLILDKDSVEGSQRIEALEKEILETGVIQEGRIDPSLLMSPREMPNLHALFQSSVTHSNPVIVRYVEKGIKIKDIEVPRRTYLAVVAEESPFSEGRRNCPGKSVAEAVFKTFVVGCLQDRVHKKKQEGMLREECERVSFRVAYLLDGCLLYSEEIKKAMLGRLLTWLEDVKLPKIFFRGAIEEGVRRISHLKGELMEKKIKELEASVLQALQLDAV